MQNPLVEYRRIGLHPTCIGNERIRLEGNGRLSYAKNTRECAEGQLWSDELHFQGRVGADALAALIDTIKCSGVIDLPETMVDPSAEGGKREELDLFIDGIIFGRILENSEHPAFSTVVRHLRRLLMEMRASLD